MIIGIAGPARAGKDTAAQIIQEIAAGDWQIHSFAEPMKEMLAAGFGLSAEQLYGHAKDVVDPRYGCSPRHMLQTLGTEWGRELIGSDIWVQALEHKVAGKNCLIPDVRFANEAEMCRRHGLVVHVKGRGGIGSGHCSEAGVAAAPGDHVLYNDGDLAQYRAEIAALLRTIGISC